MSSARMDCAFLASRAATDRLSFRITPHDLIVDEVTIGAGTVIEHELTRRLFRARIANLEIDRTANTQTRQIRKAFPTLRTHA